MNAKKSRGIVAGIDLGTTLSVLAVFGACRTVDIVPNADGSSATPSLVNLSDENEPSVGSSAENQYAYAPEFTIGLFKRIMGRMDDQGEPIPAFVHPDSHTPYPPELLSSFVIRYLIDSAEAALGAKVMAIVITVPAYFDHAARVATRRAGELGGVKVLQVVNEPTAAALAFGYDKKESGTLAVYDLGGGTFDITILQVEGDTYDVVATDGDRDLGGADIDNLIAGEVVAAFNSEHGIEITPETDLIIWRELLVKSENMKKALSQASKAEFMIAAGDKRLIFEMTREGFEALISPIVNTTETITKRAIEAAKLTPNDIGHVVLVGGSTRIPAVRAMLTSVFGDKLRTDINPDEAVAMGAAILAARVGSDDGIAIVDGAGNEVLPPPVEVSDVTSQSLCCLAMQNGEMRASVIIPANTHVPAKMQETFGLERDGQTAVRVTIVSGADGAKPEDCIIYGELTLSSLPPRPVGDGSIEVQYEFTVEGTLKVTVRDKISGKSTSEIKKGLSGLFSSPA